MSKLFAIKGFFPYTVMLFLNAFVDLGHKIIIQNAVFKIYDGEMQVILTAIVNALILLPYILLFSASGYISDKYPKHKVMRYSAMAEVFTVSFVIVAYYLGWFWLAFALTLLMAIQSAIYSPAKYGYIRELVGIEHLAAANGVVQAVTIIAILGGTLVFSALFEWILKDIVLLDTTQIMQLIYPLGFLILFFAVLEFILAFYLPARRNIDSTKTFSMYDYWHGRYFSSNINAITRTSIIWLSIVGLLVFWSASQVVLASFPAFAKEVLLETNTLVIQGVLASTGLGIVAGSLFAGRVSRNAIESSLVPAGVVGFSVLIGIIPQMDSAFSMALVFALIGFFGGIYIVPLNALMQYHAREDDIGTVLAGNNWIQNIAMFMALVLTIILAASGVDSTGLFYCLMLACLMFAVYIIIRLPHSMVRFVYILYQGFGAVEIVGFMHLPKHRGVLLVGEFQRWTDFALVQMACPDQVYFFSFGKAVQALPENRVCQWLGMNTVETKEVFTLYKEITALLESGKFVCLQTTDAESYKQWLDENTGSLSVQASKAITDKAATARTPCEDMMPKAVIAPFYIDRPAAQSRQEIINSHSRYSVHVILGKTLALEETLQSMNMHLAELPFQWRRYAASDNSGVFP